MQNQRKSGVILNYVSICLNMIIGLTYTPFLIRALGKSEYGIYSLAASIIAYLTVLDLGFGNAIVRYVSKYRAEGKIKEQERLIGMFIVLYSIIGIVAFSLGLFLSFNVELLFSTNMNEYEVSQTGLALLIMSLNLAFTFPFSIWGSLMTAYEQFTFKRLFVICRNILNPVVMIFLLMIGYKAIALVIVTSLFNFLTLLADYLYCRYKIKINYEFGHFDFKLLKEISAYSFWIFLNAIIDRIYWSSGQFVLGIVKGTSSIAVYAVAVQLHSFYMMFSTAISSVFLPKVTALTTKNGGDKEISDLFIKTGRFQFFVMSFILVSFIVFGRNFVIMWAGADYVDSYYIALLFFIPLTVPLIQTLGITILQARNQMKFRSLLYVSIAVLSFILAIPLAQQYGGIGCAVSTSVAIFIGHALIMNIYYQKNQNIDIKRFWIEISRMSVCPIIILLIFSLLPYFFNVYLSDIKHFVLYFLLFFIVYSITFWKFSLNCIERSIFVNIFCSLKKKIIRV